MLQSISWSHYTSFLLVATIFYYLFIWLVIYKARIPVLSRIGSIGSVGLVSLHGEDGPDEMISTAQHVMDELRPLFRPGTSKNELVFSLQQYLKKYNQWEEPGFRETVNSFILGAFQTICSIRLSEDDLSALWK